MAHERFLAHLDRASAIVKTWPAWKQNLLGRTEAQMSIETLRPFDPTDEDLREEAERRRHRRIARRKREQYECRLERGFALMGAAENEDTHE